MSEQFDIAVIGGGVVGLAILRRFAMAGLKCVLLERGPDILSGASKANSALLHTGFDAPPGSLELACMQAGYAEYLGDPRQAQSAAGEEFGAGRRVGRSDEVAKLDGIVAKAHANGVNDVRQIAALNYASLNRNLATAARAAVLVPGEHIIDAWSAPLAYAHQAWPMAPTILRKPK